MSENGSPPSRRPDPDLYELAYMCGLDAMAASEQYETMTRLDDADAGTRRRFDSIVRDVRETMAVSGDADRTDAPPELRDRILGAVSDTAQVAPDGAPAEPAARATVLPLRPSRRVRRGVVVGTAAAAAAVVVGIGVAVSVNGTDTAPPAVVAAAPLESPVTGGGTMVVDVISGQDTVVVHMNDVPAPPPGSVYQMWLFDGSPVSAGTMDAAALGVPASVPIDDATALTITVEPVGGSPFPTTDAVARINLT